MGTLVLALLVAASPARAPEPADSARAVGVVAGGLAGALTAGIGTYAYGYSLIESGACSGVGCEGAAGIIVLAPVAAVLGGLIGAVVGGLSGASIARAIDGAEV